MLLVRNRDATEAVTGRSLAYRHSPEQLTVKGMSAQSRTMRREHKTSRRKPTGLVLLETAETKLREGNERDARKLLRAIVKRCPPSLERLAALSYLRAA